MVKPEKIVMWTAALLGALAAALELFGRLRVFDVLRSIAAWVFGAAFLVAFSPLLLVGAIVIYDAIIARKNDDN